MTRAALLTVLGALAACSATAPSPPPPVPQARAQPADDGDFLFVQVT